MRNKIDLSVAPKHLFANPWSDDSIRLLTEPEFMWRTAPRGTIVGFSLSAHDEIERKINKHLWITRKHRTFKNAIEHSSVPIVVERAAFRKSFVTQDDKILLTGAAGQRAINQHRTICAEQCIDADITLNRYFETSRVENAGRDMAVYSGLLDDQLHFAVPCRNTFNYFHFITEALSQLCVLDGMDFQGNVYFHYPNSEEKHRAFADDFVSALFPEFEGRVFFERAPKDYDRVVTGMDVLGCCEMAPEQTFRGISRHASNEFRSNGGAANIIQKPTLSMNGVSTALLALRARALRAIDGIDFSYLPKRFYVGRTIDHSRPRAMDGEDLLFKHLELFDFEYVMFETLSPLEQIAIMAQAEAVVSSHGAGFTNMLFANPDAYVIEMGTLQTAQHRWGDFWPLAHAAQCNYINFFCDFNSQNPTLEPIFSEDGIVPVAMSERAVSHVMAFIVAVLGQYPKLPSIPLLTEVSRQLVSVNAAAQAVGLLDAHPGVAVGNADICLVLADAYKQLDDTKSELLALDQAYKANVQRWQTLVRIIWCANRCERPQVIRWALAKLKRNFPDRHKAFVGNHEWVRFVA